MSLIRPDPAGLRITSSIRGIIGVDNARAWTKPVIARGKLYLRHANQLYCCNISG